MKFSFFTTIVLLSVIASIDNAIIESIFGYGALKVGSIITGATVSLWSAYQYRDKLEEYVPETCFLSVYTPNYTDLPNKIFGQHLAVTYVPPFFKQHILDPKPSRPLLFYFHGWSGTGKNYMVELLLNQIYPKYSKNRKSEFVYHFTGSHFNPKKAEETKQFMMKTIDERLRKCPTSAFIFDEVDNFPPKYLDFLAGYINSHGTPDITYNKAIFILLGNQHGNFINALYHRKTQIEFLEREQLTIDDFEGEIVSMVNQEGALSDSKLLNSGLIQLIVPFLPLTQQHVKDCIILEFKNNGFKEPLLYPGVNVINKILAKQSFRENGLYASQGCRNIASSVKKEMISLGRKQEM